MFTHPGPPRFFFLLGSSVRARATVAFRGRLRTKFCDGIFA